MGRYLKEEIFSVEQASKAMDELAGEPDEQAKKWRMVLASMRGMHWLFAAGPLEPPNRRDNVF